MKASIALLAVATATSVAASGSHLHHHHHRHHHLAKREAEVVTVDGPTVYVYKLGDKLIDQNEACEGIKEGSLAFTGEELPEDACSPKTSPAAGGQFFEKPSAPIEKPKPKPTPEAPKPPPPPPKPVVPEVEDIVEDILGGGGLDSDFPDGKLDCSEFPSKYGPLKLDYLGIGGWSGIQYVSGGAGGYSSIHTAIKGDKCKDGAMCSYACPPGYQKSQWPQAQGVNGESIGGIECRGGKLYLTNPKYKKLCISGSGGVQVQNTMSEIAAICRTDYPGTESEVVPLLSKPGATDPLTCPDAGDYYSWKGMATSAQYYVNPKGVPVEKGCQWGDGSEPIGNWAPINLGVGKKDGATWISIFQNKPTTLEKLNFKIEIKGDNLSGACRYENGMFYSLTGSNADGCTVQVMSGTATFVLSS